MRKINLLLKFNGMVTECKYLAKGQKFFFRKFEFITRAVKADKN